MGDRSARRSRLGIFSSRRSFGARALVILVTGVLVLGVTSIPALALPVNQFELDGNALYNGHDDWQNVLGFSGPAGSDFNHSFITDVIGGPHYFTGGGSKDIHDVSSWAYNSLGAQDKDEITHAYSAAYLNSGHLNLYFGMDRYSNSGDSTAGFWFFQNKIGTNGSGKFTGTHAVGDLLIVSDFSNGGAISSIKAYKWNGTGLTAFTAVGGDCSVAISDPLCAIVNQTDTASPWSYTPKSGTANVFPAIGSFLEGGIDLNDTNIFGSNVPCFSSFLAETRASTSTDSTLSDFALGGVNTCGKVTGTKYNDINGNGTRDNGEPGLANWTISLTGNGTTITTTTDSSGNFEFDDVTPGTYLVCETEQATWFQTEPSSGGDCSAHGGGHGYSITVGQGQTVSDNIFGNTQHPHLTITKTADAPSTVSAGDTIGYTITVGNTGPGTAVGVKLSDTLPNNPGLDWKITAPAPSAGWGGTCGITAGVLACGGSSGVTLASGDSLSVHISSTTTKATCGTVSNTATVSGTNNDGSPSAGPVDITVNCPVLTITKVADATTVNAGDPIGYTITVTNTAAGTAHGVKLSDTLPTNTGLSWSITAPGQSAGWGGTCVIDTGVLTCGGTNGVDLAPSASLSVHISSPTTKDTCGTVANSASATSGNDGSPTVGPVDITVLCPNLEITKTADATTVNAGDTIGYTITVHNTGAGQASGVKLSDTLPANDGLSWSITPPSPSTGWGGTCGINAGVLACGDTTGVTLASGASLSVHISSPTTAATCGTVANSASATSGNDGSPSVGPVDIV